MGDTLIRSVNEVTANHDGKSAVQYYGLHKAIDPEQIRDHVQGQLEEQLRHQQVDPTIPEIQSIISDVAILDCVAQSGGYVAIRYIVSYLTLEHSGSVTAKQSSLLLLTELRRKNPRLTMPAIVRTLFAVESIANDAEQSARYGIHLRQSIESRGSMSHTAPARAGSIARGPSPEDLEKWRTLLQDLFATGQNSERAEAIRKLLRGIAEWGSEPETEVLTELLPLATSDDGRIPILSALGTLGGSKASATLAALAQESSGRVQRAAVSALDDLANSPLSGEDILSGSDDSLASQIEIVAAKASTAYTRALAQGILARLQTPSNARCEHDKGRGT